MKPKGSHYIYTVNFENRVRRLSQWLRFTETVKYDKQLYALDFFWLQGIKFLYIYSWSPWHILHLDSIKEMGRGFRFYSFQVYWLFIIIIPSYFGAAC
jgi:hypothetical protein